MNNNTGRMVLGTILIAAGVVIFGNLYGYWHFNLFFAGWWTLFLIVPGIISMAQGAVNFGNVILVLIGAMLLLGQQGIIDESQAFKLIFPLILIMLGIFIFIGSNHKNHHSVEGSIDSEDNPNYVAVFSRNNVTNASQQLRGGNATSMFGNMVVDLKQARVQNDFTFNSTVLFGGINILVPSEVRVRVTGIPIFGANEVKVVSPTDEKLPLITFNCITLFGSTEVK